jgi:hypothetical protein
MIKKWWEKEACWWEFWYPQSGGKGGALMGLCLFLGILMIARALG